MRRLWELFWVTTRLGLTSFGGPVAHLGYFYNEYVKRRGWLDEESYADLVALCQFLPGPASSQVGIAVGIQRAGLLGGVVSWLGFTWPSALFLILFAAALQRIDIRQAPWLHGLMLAAVAVVAQAVWSMATKLATGRLRATMAVVSALISLLVPSGWVQVALIAIAAVIGRLWIQTDVGSGAIPVTIPVRREVGLALLAVFALLLAGLPLLRMTLHTSSPSLALFDEFYRTGALVFGGGHVVLPLLQRDVVPAGWVSNASFLAGYGAAQAVPGPLFTFAAYLGYIAPAPGGVIGALLGLVAIFVPGYLLVAGTLPFWAVLRRHPAWQSAIAGVNAAVVGILLAALYNPVWTSAVHTPADFGLALVAFTLLTVWRVPPWAVVLFCAAGGFALRGV
jgi:chromate transporter